MPGTGIEVRGIGELRAALRATGPQWPKALRQVHKVIAEEGANQSRKYAAGMGGIQAKAAGAIKGRSTQTSAKVSVGTGGVPFALVAFLGAKRHTGWYARPWFSSGPAQHPKWVGNSWEAAVAGQGPYAINPALAAYIPYFLEDYTQMLDALFSEAFPER